MNILIALVFTVALLVSTKVIALTYKAIKYDRPDYQGIPMACACVLWGIFYYLTH